MLDDEIHMLLARRGYPLSLCFNVGGSG